MNDLWSRSTARSTARWVMAIPLLLVGSMLFWTTALGSGAISLLAVTGFAGVPQASDDLATPVEVAPTAIEPMPGPTLGSPANPIMIHLQESAEPEDVNDNLGAALPSESDDDGTGQMSGQALSPADPN